jgi:hypothetical protein
MADDGLALFLEQLNQPAASRSGINLRRFVVEEVSDFSCSLLDGKGIFRQVMFVTAKPGCLPIRCIDLNS